MTIFGNFDISPYGESLGGDLHSCALIVSFTYFDCVGVTSI